MKKLFLILLLIFSCSACHAAGIDAYTVLMLHMDGIDGGSTFTDDSFSEHTVTNNGSELDSAQKKFGTTSGLFNGSTENLTLADSDDWDFGTDPYTIDVWIRDADDTQDNQRILSSDGAYGHLLSFDSTTYIQYECGDSGDAWVVQINTGNGSVEDDVWYHVAIVREGTGANETKIYLDGVEKATGTYNDNSADANTTGLYIGRLGWADLHYYNGWLDEYRISKGIARWDANFDPPTEAYSVGSSRGRFLLITKKTFIKRKNGGYDRKIEQWEQNFGWKGLDIL